MVNSDKIIAVRKVLHAKPEPARMEAETQAAILSFLNDIHSPRLVIKTHKTAVLVEITGNTPFVIAYRADMDALRIKEETGCAFASQNGLMHACGHDVHMTVALGLIAEIIRTNLEQSFLFIFQPAEESGGGALELIEAGLFKVYNIKEIYAIHVAPELKINELVVKEQVLFAYAQEVNVIIHGREAHGAKPYEGVDTIAVSAFFLTQLNTVLTRFITDSTRKVVTFGKITGGVAMNIVARETVIEGSVRCQDEAVFNDIKAHLEALKKGLELTYGCTIDLEYGPLYPNVINNKDLASRFRKQALENGYSVNTEQTYMYGEDFGAYSHLYPALLVMVGAESPYPLHHAKMLPDERILEKTVDLFINYFCNKPL